MSRLDEIINESIENYLTESLILEKKKTKKKKRKPEGKEKKPKKFRKKAIKAKGGLRKDFDVDDDRKYNQNVDDQEQSSITDILDNGFVNVKKVAEKYPTE